MSLLSSYDILLQHYRTIYVILNALARLPEVARPHTLCATPQPITFWCFLIALLMHSVDVSGFFAGYKYLSLIHICIQSGAILIPCFIFPLR